jgi:hypothetical protein
LIVSLVFGLLLESVTTNLADIGRARLEARAAQLAEQRVRELESEIASGAEVELGVSEGGYEAPDEDLHWEITVSEHTLDLPEDYPGEESPSPLFARPGAALSPAAQAVPGQAPPLRLVEVRVFEASAFAESADPFVLLVTAPPDPARLEQLEQQRQPTPPVTEGATEGVRQ